MDIYTARYSYKGHDRLDITVAGNDPVGRAFAPSWKIVMGLKNGLISESEYRNMYQDILNRVYQKSWDVVLNMESVTLVCFCQVGAFCHRYMLAGHLETLGATYKGERPW